MDEEKVVRVCPLIREQCVIDRYADGDPHPVCTFADDDACVARDVLDGAAKLLAQLLDDWQENQLRVEVVS